MRDKDPQSTHQVYRIRMKCGGWLTKSERYYTAEHSSQALADLYHSFYTGRVHAKSISIYGIDEYNRFSNKWEDRLENALQHAQELHEDVVIVKRKIILRR